MEFQKVLETRRSVRKYDPNVSVTREQMEELIRAAQEAPSWKNSQTGRYYCVLSEEIADKIRETCLPQARNAEKSKHASPSISDFIFRCNAVLLETGAVMYEGADDQCCVFGFFCISCLRKTGFADLICDFFG